MHKTLSAKATGKGKSCMKCCVVGAKNSTNPYTISQTKRKEEQCTSISFLMAMSQQQSARSLQCVNHFKADCIENQKQYTTGFASIFRLMEKSICTDLGR